MRFDVLIAPPHVFKLLKRIGLVRVRLRLSTCEPSSSPAGWSRGRPSVFVHPRGQHRMDVSVLTVATTRDSTNSPRAPVISDEMVLFC